MITIIKTKLMLYGALIAIIGLIILYLTLPISDTYLVDDVQVVQSTLDHRTRFLALVQDEFVEEVEQIQAPVTGIRDKVVQTALSQVGTREQNGNTNIIKYNDWYQPMHTWLTGRDEYCAIFTLWVFNEVGMFLDKSKAAPTIDSASCDELVARYMKNNRFALATSNYDPKPGDLIFFTKWAPSSDNPTGYDSNHVGLVVDSDENYVYTVEGNTSIPAGEFQRAGNGVYSKKHAKPKAGSSTRILGYAVPWYEGDPEFKAVNGIPS